MFLQIPLFITLTVFEGTPLDEVTWFVYFSSSKTLSYSANGQVKVV